MKCGNIMNHINIPGCGCNSDLGALSQYVTVVVPIHLVKDKNVLTQCMIDQENVKYVIKWDFVLGEDITVPENCLIEFDGGSISNDDENTYTLTGQNTAIIAPPTKIFGLNVELAGTWNVSEAYPEWFGAKGDGETVDTLPIQKVMDYFNTILFSKVYISRPIIFRSNRVVNFAPESKIYATEDYQDYEDLNDPSHPPKGWSPDCIFELTKVSNVTINGNGAELSMLDYFQYDKGTGANKYAYSQSRHCVRINCSQNVSIYNLNCNQSGGDGFCLGWGSEGLDTTNYTYQHNENILLYGCGADHNKRQGISVIDGINVLIEGCSLKRTFRDPGAGIDVESNLSNEQYYALRNINMVNCYTEGNIEGIRITPQHYTDTVSISVINHTSYDDFRGFMLNRVGHGGGDHPKSKGTILVEDYSIINPKTNGINLFNMFASDINIDIRKVFIKNVGSSGSTINRERSAIFMRDENYYGPVEGTYNGNYTISDVTIDDDREQTNCFAYIYGEITDYADHMVYPASGDARFVRGVSLKNVSITNIKGITPCVNGLQAIAIVPDDQVTYIDPSVLFDITPWDTGEPTSHKITIAKNRGYIPIRINNNSIELTTTIYAGQPFKFINYSGLGRLLFLEGEHCLRYNNDVISEIRCKDSAIGAELVITYNGSYWEVVNIKGDWDIKKYRKGSTAERPYVIGQGKPGGFAYNFNILNPLYDVGYEYFDVELNKKIIAKTISLGKSSVSTETLSDTNVVTIGNVFGFYEQFNVSIQHESASTIEVYVSSVADSIANTDAVLLYSGLIEPGNKGIDIGTAKHSNEYPYIIFRSTDASSINTPTVSINKYYPVKWVDDKGFTAALSKGNSNQRPTSILTTDDAGFEYYDTQINKIIYLKVENELKSWVDALGNPLNTIYDAVAGSNTDNPVEDEEPTD